MKRYISAVYYCYYYCYYYYYSNFAMHVCGCTGPLGLNPINTDSKSRFCIWLTSEPSGKLSDALLQALRIISWDNLNDELLGSEDPAQPGPEVPIADTSLDDLLKTGEGMKVMLKALDTWAIFHRSAYRRVLRL